MHRWRIPSGEVRTNDDGDPFELGATASRFGPELTTGVAVMASPAVLVRGTVGLQTGKPIDAFTWRHDDDDDEVVPLTDDGDFRLGTTGLSAGVSTSWVF